jgi:hypothetical protein
VAAQGEATALAVAQISAKLEPSVGIRTALICSYDIPRSFFRVIPGWPVKQLDKLGCMIYYAHELGYTGRRKRTVMDVDAVVAGWRKAVVGLVTAHDKDEADRQEAAIDNCLTPILSAPIKQVREFYPKLLAALKADPAVPFLVWRSFEIWVDMIISKATDEDIKQLKTDLAKEIVALVEGDVRDQLPQAMVRALQWRSADTLESVKEAVIEGQKKGEKVRLRGRESCLFIEVGGTEENPEVCVQI